MSKIRESARGQQCTLRVAGGLGLHCAGEETTVLCHAPPGSKRFGGKGIGMKVPDTWAAYGCSTCHDIMDGRITASIEMHHHEWLEAWYRGIYETQTILGGLGKDE